MDADPSTEVWTIGRLLSWTRDWFTQRGVEQPRLSAELLLAHAIACERIQLYTRFDQVPEPAQVAEFRSLVRRAAEHTPIAYLIGKKEFYSLEFEVTPAVLIPRPESEALVERVVEHCTQAERDTWQIWDMGTGSGCLAVAVCKQVPSARCLATDISADALEVAARNVNRHGLADRIKLACANGLAINPELTPDGGFDILMSNPPYVANDEMDRLDENVRAHEPLVALRAGPDGLHFYGLLAQGGPHWLRPGGAVLVEIGYGQENKVEQLFTATSAFEHAGTWRDVPGAHERVVKFVYRAHTRGSGNTQRR